MSEMTKFGADLIQAMSEALAHSQGKDVAGMRVHSVDLGSVDAKAIRQKLDLTQDWPLSWARARLDTRNGSRANANPPVPLELCSGSWSTSLKPFSELSLLDPPATKSSPSR